ncbi:amidohydrolase family protein [Kaistella palustris]|uniref:hypothetical protein n=1 Tax=Kaistella palustris TaxID=493376 RepID=UPI000401033D|nr:hypothetical protein [Kaistella palustris]
MEKKYFDLHLHPLFKNFLSRYDVTVPPLNRKLAELTQPVRMSNAITSVVDELFIHILKSQSCIEQCEKGNAAYIVAAIVNLEFGFADSRGFFGNILKSRFSNPLDKTFFEKVRRGEVSYYRLMLMELSLYKQLRDHKESPVAVLSRNSSNTSGTKPLNIIFSLEGSHNFSKLMIGNPLVIDHVPDRYIDLKKSVKLSEVADNLWREMITDPETAADNHSQNPAVNFEHFYKSLAKEKMDLLYLTLTHLTHISEQFLATHAFGMKMLKHPSFYPYGNGITTAGYEVIEKCYSLTNDKNEYRPVILDVKHLGLKSRQDFYAFRKSLIQKEKKYANIPIIASHIGVTGYTYNEWKNALKRDTCTVYNYEGTRAVSVEMDKKNCGKWGSFVNNDFSFNPWSINLMDEDITEILSSNGIMGMSLDVRILGFQSEYGIHLNSENEFLSTADFQTHFPQITVKNLPVNTMESMVTEQESWLILTKEDRHPLAFCFNIIHIIQVGLLKTEISEPWKQICLGSDFDGLIEPLKVSPDISSLGELEANMIKWLPVAEKAYVDENGGTCVLANKSTADLKSVVRGIMYDNGKAFIDRWLRNFEI